MALELQKRIAVSEQHHSRAGMASVADPPTVTEGLLQVSPVLVISDLPEYGAAFASVSSDTAIITSGELLRVPSPSADTCVIVGVARGTADACIAALQPKCSLFVLFTADSPDITNTRVLRVAQDHPDPCVVLAFVHLLAELHSSQKQTKAAELNAQQEQRHATLGRYMLQVRHEINNVLTSIIGNTELLQMRDADTDPAECTEQLDTVHAMSLRLHEILQRFSSLDAEMRLSARPSQTENERPAPRYLPQAIHDPRTRKPVDL